MPRSSLLPIKVQSENDVSCDQNTLIMPVVLHCLGPADAEPLAGGVLQLSCLGSYWYACTGWVALLFDDVADKILSCPSR